MHLEGEQPLQFALFFLAEYANMVLISSLTAIFFLKCRPNFRIKIRDRLLLVKHGQYPRVETKRKPAILPISSGVIHSATAFRRAFRPTGRPSGRVAGSALATVD